MTIGIYTTLVRRWTCGEGACSRDDRIADAVLTDAPRSKCGSWLACKDGLTAGRDVGFDRVHIRYLGNGHLGFRPGGSLLKSRNAGPGKSKQNALAPPLGTSLGLGVPVIRQ